MKMLLVQWAARLDESSLRERALVFIVVASVVVAVVHAVALQPLLREQRGYLDRITLDQGQLKAISDELGKSAKAAADDPRIAKTARIRKLEVDVASAEKRLTQRRDAEQLTPAQLGRMLQDMMGRNPNLQLRALRVLPATALPATRAPAALPSSTTKTPPQGQFYRHGIEIEMNGTYLELLAYLEKVEALPWRLSWTSVELQTKAYPEILLRGTVSTVSSSPNLISF